VRHNAIKKNNHNENELSVAKTFKIILGGLIMPLLLSCKMTEQEQKADCEALMNDMINFGQKMLREHGEFYPYAASMKLDGSIVSISADTGEELPKGEEVMKVLASGLRESAAAKTIKASAIFFNITLHKPTAAGETDAIQVSLEHRDGWSGEVYFPYKLSKGNKLQVGQIFATRNQRQIFQ